jgi:protein-S-isoprenylcysteine O-methyltransferase Ste14
VLLLAGCSLVLLRGAYFANRGILDQPGDRLMGRRLATCGSLQYWQSPMALGAVVLSPGLGLFLLSPSILLFAAPLFLFCHVLAVPREEPKRGNGFGQTYRE